jgi:hypothetical protein
MARRIFTPGGSARTAAVLWMAIALWAGQSIAVGETIGPSQEWFPDGLTFNDPVVVTDVQNIVISACTFRNSLTIVWSNAWLSSVSTTPVSVELTASTVALLLNVTGPSSALPPRSSILISGLQSPGGTEITVSLNQSSSIEVRDSVLQSLYFSESVWDGNCRVRVGNVNFVAAVRGVHRLALSGVTIRGGSSFGLHDSTVTTPSTNNGDYTRFNSFYGVALRRVHVRDANSSIAIVNTSCEPFNAPTFLWGGCFMADRATNFASGAALLVRFTKYDPVQVQEGAPVAVLIESAFTDASLEIDFPASRTNGTVWINISSVQSSRLAISDLVGVRLCTEIFLGFGQANSFPIRRIDSIAATALTVFNGFLGVDVTTTISSSAFALLYIMDFAVQAGGQLIVRDTEVWGERQLLDLGLAGRVYGGVSGTLQFANVALATRASIVVDSCTFPRFTYAHRIVFSGVLATGHTAKITVTKSSFITPTYWQSTTAFRFAGVLLTGCSFRDGAELAITDSSFQSVTDYIRLATAGIMMDASNTITDPASAVIIARNIFRIYSEMESVAISMQARFGNSARLYLEFNGAASLAQRQEFSLDVQPQGLSNSSSPPRVHLSSSGLWNVSGDRFVANVASFACEPEGAAMTLRWVLMNSLYVSGCARAATTDADTSFRVVVENSTMGSAELTSNNNTALLAIRSCAISKGIFVYGAGFISVEVQKSEFNTEVRQWFRLYLQSTGLRHARVVDNIFRYSLINHAGTPPYCVVAVEATAAATQQTSLCVSGNRFLRWADGGADADGCGVRLKDSNVSHLVLKDNLFQYAQYGFVKFTNSHVTGSMLMVRNTIEYPFVATLPFLPNRLAVVANVWTQMPSSLLMQPADAPAVIHRTVLNGSETTPSRYALCNIVEGAQSDAVVAAANQSGQLVILNCSEESSDVLSPRQCAQVDGASGCSPGQRQQGCVCDEACTPFRLPTFSYTAPQSRSGSVTKTVTSPKRQSRTKTLESPPLVTTQTPPIWTPTSVQTPTSSTLVTEQSTHTTTTAAPTTPSITDIGTSVPANRPPSSPNATANETSATTVAPVDPALADSVAAKNGAASWFVAQPSTAAATVAVAVITAANMGLGNAGPSAASSTARVQSSLRLLSCDFDAAEETVEFLVFPIQFDVSLGGNRNGAFSLRLNGAVIASTAILCAALVAFSVAASADDADIARPAGADEHGKPKRQRFGRKLAGVSLGVVVACFGPALVGASTLSLGHLATSTAEYCVYVVAFIASLVATIVPMRKALQLISAPRLPQLNHVGLMIVDATAMPPASRWAALYFAEDIGFAMSLELITNLYLDHPSWCFIAPLAALALSLLHLGYLIAVHPYTLWLEHWLAIAGGVVQTFVVGGTIGTRFADSGSTFVDVLAWAFIAQIVLLFLQPIVLLVWEVLVHFGVARQSRRAPEPEAVDAADDTVLLEVPMIPAHPPGRTVPTPTPTTTHHAHSPLTNPLHPNPLGAAR